MIVWLITKMICWLYGVEVGEIARWACMPLSFLESILELIFIGVFINNKVSK